MSSYKIVVAELLRSLIFLAMISGTVQLQAIPERADLTYINEKYISFGNLSVVRYGRKSLYYINCMISLKYPWNNNVTVSAIYYERLSNEYKRSFVELKYKLCDLINKDPYAGTVLKNTGLKCPVPAGFHSLMNMTSGKDFYFPYKIPFERCRIDISIENSQTGEVLALANIYMTYKQTVVNKTTSRRKC